MRGNFEYYNPTKLIFGENSVDKLKNEIEKYGKNILLVYGGGSIKRNGLYDKVMNILKDANKNVTELAGVMPNPTLAKLYEGIQLARESKIDFILAVGGGSVIDYCKGLAASINLKGEDPWKKYYLEMQEADCECVPIGSILTMVGTGSEMNGGSVITNTEQKLKIGKVFGSYNFPKFAILDPTLTYTVPRYQMVAGIFDIMSHIMEQYFSDIDDSASDYIMEGMMRALINASRVAIKNPQDYDARSNIMWISTWALNTFVSKGKTEDWEVHMIGQAIGAVTNATHGMTLSAVSIPYYQYVMPFGLLKFKRFAEVVWGVESYRFNNDATMVAKEGLRCMSDWMKEIGLVMRISDLGVKEADFDDIINGTFLLNGGYKELSKDELLNILKEAM